MLLFLFLLLATSCVVGYYFREHLDLWFRFSTPKRRPATPSAHSPARRSCARAMIILGSGGHTMEMLQMLSTVSSDPTQHTLPLLPNKAYVIADSDTSSFVKLKQFQEATGSPSHDTVLTISRARRVAQSWWTTPWTTLRSFMQAFGLLRKVRPQLILCNGPGTCIPICVAAKLLNIVFRLNITCFYIESIARVQHLSLSGLLFYYLRLGVMAVQWPILHMQYPRTKYKGILV